VKFESDVNPVIFITLVEVPSISWVYVPPLSVLNSKSTPFFCLKKSIPTPTLDAVFTSPLPPPEASILIIPPTVVIVVLLPPLIVLNCKSVPDLPLNTSLAPPTLEELSILLLNSVSVSPSVCVK